MNVQKVTNMMPGFVCKSCRGEFQYAPILMPKGRPYPIEKQPGFMDYEHIEMCTGCVAEELKVLNVKIERGEMFPLQVWEVEGRKASLEEAIYQTDEGEKSASEVFPDLFRR